MRVTQEADLGILDFRLSAPPSLLGKWFSVFFKDLRSLGTRFRILAEFLDGTEHDTT